MCVCVSVCYINVCACVNIKWFKSLTCPVIEIVIGEVAVIFVDAVPWVRGLIPQADASAAETPSAAMFGELSVPC